MVEASRLIAPYTRSQFIKKNGMQLKAAKKKKIIQRFYISKPILVNLAKKEVEVTGDRILIIEGLRATQPMTFKLNYSFGERKENNLEGVYIIKERLISSLQH